MNREYVLAIAMIKFRQAWKELTDISVKVDTDLTDGYPFYLLDFEEITPNVMKWCNIHASRIINNTVDRLPNPTCLRCEYVFKGIDKSGLCVGHIAGIECGSYPEIAYSRNLVISSLSRSMELSELQKLTDDNLIVVYLDYINNMKKEQHNDNSKSN